ncbi:30S ribosomal protein S3 [Candidatus Woesearchaeota archaeon]|nr:MAG: 30S ribosomal protein S3 [Candidatus Woesearchaeota archaeon]
MIERKFIKQNMKEHAIKEYISQHVSNAGHSYTKLQRTPLGEKIIICASRPGLVVGKSGANIARLTRELKEKFHLENPQIELVEVEQPDLDPSVVSESIAGSLERYGSARFKAIGHAAMTKVMKAGALGVEIVISGKIPSTRAKSWRFYQGYLKKCGDIALVGVHKAYASAKLKTGIIGIKVSILPSTTVLPDHIEFVEQKQELVEEVTETDSAVQEIKEQVAEETQPAKKPAKKATKKTKAKKKDES